VLVAVVLRLSVVDCGQTIVLLATEDDPPLDCSGQGEGWRSWGQFGLPAQSLPRRRFRRACMRAYEHFVRVCVYMCMCVCVLTCIYVYICMCICICIRIHIYTCVYVCVFIFVHRL